jgi:hypothetical protein
MLSDTNTKADEAELSSCHVHQVINVIRPSPCIVSNLSNPDLLHTMPLSMLEHLLKSISNFMKTHGWLDKYNAI